MADLLSDSDDDDDFQSADEGEDIDIGVEKNIIVTLPAANKPPGDPTVSQREIDEIEARTQDKDIEKLKNFDSNRDNEEVVDEESVKCENPPSSSTEQEQNEDQKLDKIENTNKSIEVDTTESVKIEDSNSMDPLTDNGKVKGTEEAEQDENDKFNSESLSTADIQLNPNSTAKDPKEQATRERIEDKLEQKEAQKDDFKDADLSAASEAIPEKLPEPKTDKPAKDDVIMEQPRAQNFESDTKESEKDDDGWGNEGWGWDTFETVISSATTKVSAAVEKVESSLGIPKPSEFIASQDDVKEVSKDQVKVEQPSGSVSGQSNQEQQNSESNQGFGSWFSGFGAQLTNAVQKTSQDLVTGSVGALEFIGKKTIDVISEGDPGLRKKRGKGGPSLSQMLREAQEQKEIGANPNNEQGNTSSVTFATEFERFSGMDHLQTLEILSNESERKLERILNIQSEDALMESKEILLILNRNFTLHEGDSVDAENNDFCEHLRRNCEGMKGKATLSVEKLIETHKQLLERLHKTPETDKDNDYETLADERFKTAISGLAEMTARCLELSRKTAEVLCADDVKSKTMCLTRASLYRKNTEILRNELASLASLFAHQLDEIASQSESRRISFLVTDIHLEGANCCSYMEDCHRLVLPILQLSAIR